MKKLCILLLTLILVCYLCSCGLVGRMIGLKKHYELTLPYETTNLPESVEYTTDEYYEATEYIPETTAAETEPIVEIIPTVITAENYEKDAIDAFYPENKFDFTHKVAYPKIDSEKSGAAALNAKIAEKYGKIINELKNNEEDNVLYHISYGTSECNGIIFIHILEQIGWQYSEGFDSQVFYYYDTKNDKELTIAEYLAAFNIDRDKLDIGVRTSHELARSGLGVNPYLTEKIGGEPIGAPSPDTLYYRAYESFDSSVEFEGVEFISGKKPVIRAYLSGTVYITSTFSCEVYADEYSPVYPSYAGYSMPTGTNESNDIIALFDGGKVISLSAPSKYEIQAINYSSSGIELISKNNIHDSRISINGCEPYYWSSGAIDGPEDDYVFVITYSMNEYIPINEFRSVVITVIEE